MAKKNKNTQSATQPTTQLPNVGLRQQIAWATKNNPSIIPDLLAKGKTYQHASSYTKHRWENTAAKTQIQTV